VNKIVRAVQRCSSGLSQVEPMRIASKTIGGLYDGATTREMDTISIDTAASLIAEEPQYSKLAARLLLGTIVKEVAGQNLHSFSQSLDYGYRQGIVNPATAEFVSTHAHHAIDDQLSDRFEFFGLRTVANSRLQRLGIAPVFRARNPFSFMELQDVQELTNFFERRVSAYQTAVAGEVAFHDDF
jgi:ribonucleoside-diphosphate reductase alpha chain